MELLIMKKKLIKIRDYFLIKPKQLFIYHKTPYILRIKPPSVRVNMREGIPDFMSGLMTPSVENRP